MTDTPELYFKSDADWYDWLLNNHNQYRGVYLIFYKLELNIPTIRWESAVKVALCFGWIDSTVKSLGNGKRRQYFCPRNPKSVWSALNKKYIRQLISENLMHESGLVKIKIAKQNGSWTALNDVENLIIPNDLQTAFNVSPIAFKNYQNFARSYRKSYLYWLNQAKKELIVKTELKRLLNYVLRIKKYLNTTLRKIDV